MKVLKPKKDNLGTQDLVKGVKWTEDCFTGACDCGCPPPNKN